MTKYPRRDIAASVRQRLLNHARETGRPFSELLQYFAMERFLPHLTVGAPILLQQHSSNRLLYISFDGTYKSTIGGTQWESL